MSTPTPDPHDALTRLLASYDQALAAGGEATLTRPDLPGDLRVRFDNARRCLELLERQWPRQAEDATRTPYPAEGRGPGLGRFQLRGLLGKGGGGVVFRAFDPLLKREVALKLPRPDLLLHESARKRFEREARVAAGFDHPNLVPVFEAGSVGPIAYIASAYCPGPTLAEWLARQETPPTPAQAARLVATLADALQHAHDRGVLHRDLKPGNVILQHVPGLNPSSGLDALVPRVVDFGLAKLIDAEDETATGAVLGTPKYMAPEQAEGRRADVGPATDVYALGVILYELLTRRPPFTGLTDTEVLLRVVAGNPTSPRRLRPGVPRDLEAVCLKCLAPRPADRYPSARALADDLNRFLANRPTSARPDGPLRLLRRRLARHRQGAALAALALLALAGVGAGVWHGLHSSQVETDRDAALKATEAARVETLRRDYASILKKAFAAWRAGDANRALAALDEAEKIAVALGERPCFAADYVRHLCRPERCTVRDEPGDYFAAAFSPDGRLLATGHKSGAVVLRDPRTGQRLRALSGHAKEVNQVAFSPDGKLLAAVSDDGTVRLWKLAAGPGEADAPLPPLRGHQKAVLSVTFSPDGREVASGDDDGRIILWSLADRTARARMDCAGGRILGLAYRPDGAVLVSANGLTDAALCVWDPREGRLVKRLGVTTGVYAVAFAPARGQSGWELATGDWNGAVRLWNPEDGTSRALGEHVGRCESVALTPDGRFVVSAGRDMTLRVWDAKTGACRWILRGHAKRIWAAAVGPDGAILASVGADEALKLWDLPPAPEGPVLPTEARVDAVAFLPDGRFVAGDHAGRVAAFARSVRPDGPLGQLASPPESLAVRPDGRLIAAGEPVPSRPVVDCHDLSAGRLLFSVAAEDGRPPVAARLRPDGRVLAVGFEDGTIRLYETNSGQVVATVPGRGGARVVRLAFSPDGGWLAADGPEGDRLGVWKAATGRLRARLPELAHRPLAVAFCPGGRRLVFSPPGGCSVVVWDLDRGAEERTLHGHTRAVGALAVSPDGRTLASGCDSGEVKLWDLRTGAELLGLKRHAGPVTCLAFDAGGRTLVSGGNAPGGRGEVVLWPTTSPR